MIIERTNWLLYLSEYLRRDKPIRSFRARKIINDDVIGTKLARLNESGLLLEYRKKGKANEVPMKLLAHSYSLIYFRLKVMTKKEDSAHDFL
jgi:hypothetical protein